ncbi:nascent polypeptide-associated complex subunit alpha, muscle-specific form isoform X2 [Oreochromis niloticus]|uniref:nascent polypeptide-associated complex subunit alpha, muscle-specific form isoform X2 n=1 Tax=Oreochromis niloticus TaxID=8128 RepID=UPI000905C7D9|nr:nascent polypeptide-associated complex subunit alpha, muscle-specific form isoform X2 [Oreochromis niloticus]
MLESAGERTSKLPVMRDKPCYGTLRGTHLVKVAGYLGCSASPCAYTCSQEYTGQAQTSATFTRACCVPCTPTVRSVSTRCLRAVWSFSTRGRPLCDPVLSPPEVACLHLSSYSCLVVLQPQPEVCALPEPAPAKPHPATPATPGLALPASPAPATPATPGLALPASPAPATPATPGLALPASPAPATPATPGLALPASPAPATPATPGLALPQPANPPLPGQAMPAFQTCHTWSGTAPALFAGLTAPSFCFCTL